MSKSTKVCSTLHDSKKKILKLYQDGSELVRNVQYAADSRELFRRKTNRLANIQRRKKLENEEITLKEKFVNVISKWETATSIQFSHKIYQLFLEQKQACDQLVGEKDTTIYHLVQELERNDEAVVEEIRKQEEDIDILSSRIDCLLQHLALLCSQQLLVIREAFEEEYIKYLNHLENDCKHQLDIAQQQEMKQLDERVDLVKQCQEAVLSVERSSLQEFCALKTKLDDYLRCLTVEVQRMQGVHLLNREKLELNLQVLRKQQEENTGLLVEQKRQAIRLHDTMVTFKQQLQAVRAKGRAVVQKHMTDCSTLQGQVNSGQDMIKQTIQNNLDAYTCVWLNKEEESRALLHKIMDTHRFITEEVIGGEWNPPEINLLANRGPIYLVTPEDTPMTNIPIKLKTLSQALPSVNHKSELLPDNDYQKTLQLIFEDMGFLQGNESLDEEELDIADVPNLDTLFKNLKISNDSDMELLQQCISEVSKTIEDKDIAVALNVERNQDDDLPETVNVVKGVKKYLRIVTDDLKVPHRISKSTFSETLVDHKASKIYWRSYASSVLAQKDSIAWNLIFMALGKYLLILNKQQMLIAREDDLLKRNKELLDLLA